MKAYKGFNKDMTCNGFQFKEGGTYHEDSAVLCKSGFHACEDPIDCLSYYEPNDSVYHEVELDEVNDKRGNDSKICGKTIKIGAKIDIAGICKAHFKYVKSKSTKKHESSGDYSCNESSGYGSVNVSTGTDSKNFCNNNSSISVGWGKDNICKGEIGSYIVLVERGDWDGEKYPQIGEPKLGKIDGITLKPDTWYKIKDGEFVEVNEVDDE